MANPVINRCSCLLWQKKCNCLITLQHKKRKFCNPEKHFWLILERFIPQNLRVKAQSGLRVNFKCYQRSLESVNNFTSSVNAVTQEGLDERVRGSALQLKLKF